MYSNREIQQNWGLKLCWSLYMYISTTVNYL